MARVRHTIVGRNGKDLSIMLTPLSAIKIKCQECMGWEGLPRSVKECTSPKCPLFLFRIGRDPGRKGLTKGRPDAFKKQQKNTN